jgi:hypothetical protein
VSFRRTETSARFWTSFANILLVLGPLFALMIGTVEYRPGVSMVFMVVDQLKWALLGLILALWVVALVVAAARAGEAATQATVTVSPEQLDDLERLLAKVDEIRARQVLRRVGPEDAGTPPGATTG